MDSKIINSKTGLPIVFTTLTAEVTIGTDRTQLKNGRDVLNYLALKLTDTAREESYAVFLDAGGFPICIARVGIGDTKSTRMSPRDVVQIGLLCNAANVFMVHNHPSLHNVKNLKGCTASADDIKVSCAIAAALSLVDITLFDSLVVSSFCPAPGHKYPTYYSMRYKSLFSIVKGKAGDLEPYKAIVNDFDEVKEIDWKSFDDREYWKNRVDLEDTDKEHDVEIIM